MDQAKVNEPFESKNGIGRVADANFDQSMLCFRRARVSNLLSLQLILSLRRVTAHF